MTAQTRKPTPGPAVAPATEEVKDSPDVLSPAEVKEVAMTEAANVDKAADEATPVESKDDDPFAGVEDSAVIERTEAKRGRKAIDWETTASPFVKTNLQKSFDAYKPKMAADGKTPLVNHPGEKSFRRLNFKTPEQAKEFIRQATGLCKARGWTFNRNFVPDSDTQLSFAASPNLNEKK